MHQVHRKFVGATPRGSSSSLQREAGDSFRRHRTRRPSIEEHVAAVAARSEPVAAFDGAKDRPSIACGGTDHETAQDGSLGCLRTTSS